MTPAAFRYERKFVARGFSLEDVLALVRRHPALFREVYPTRSVNNVYLDTRGLRDYFDHANGTAHRAKTRVRWYGPLHGRVEAPVLERKIKRGVVSGKVAHPLPGFLVNGGIAYAGIEEAFDRAALPELWRSSLRHLHPSLINRYERRYFLSADGRFRLTVDSNLEFYGVRETPGRMTPARSEVFPVIIELKFDPQHGDADRVTNAVPWRVMRCSKYVVGIERVGSA